MQNVPCFARDKFHAKTKNKSFLCVQNSDKEYYEFKVKKKTYKTSIYGDEYNRFFMNYNMKHGDKIKIHLDKKGMCWFFFLEAFDKYGYPKQRVEGDFLLLDNHLHFKLLSSSCLSSIFPFQQSDITNEIYIFFFLNRGV
jgi:hypothetical protein